MTATPEPGNRDERAARIAPAQSGDVLDDLWWKPAPSAGQDTGQLRDEPDDAEYDEMRTRLLTAIRERDEARATVQRVRDLANLLEESVLLDKETRFRAAAEIRTRLDGAP